MVATATKTTAKRKTVTSSTSILPNNVQPAYLPGAVVWGKYKGYPQWPARTLQAIAVKPPTNSRVVHFPVLFFGSRFCAWLTLEHIYDFQSHFGWFILLFAILHAPQDLSQSFEAAVQDAVAANNLFQANKNTKLNIVAEKTNETFNKKHPSVEGQGNIDMSAVDILMHLHNEWKPKQFFSGDVVWAKVVGFPHWPARVVNESEMTKEAVSARIHQDATLQLTPVFFYGTYNYAWIPTQNLFSFHGNIRFLPVAKESNIWLNTAIQEAMDVRLGEERFGMVKQVLEIQEKSQMKRN